MISHQVQIPQRGSQFKAHEHEAARDRREQKKGTVPRAPRNAAVRLLSERSLHNRTFEVIAKAQGAPERTLFNPFSCKEQTLVGPARELGEHIADELAHLPAQAFALEALHAVLREIIWGVSS